MYPVLLSARPESTRAKALLVVVYPGLGVRAENKGECVTCCCVLEHRSQVLMFYLLLWGDYGQRTPAPPPPPETPPEIPPPPQPPHITTKAKVAKGHALRVATCVILAAASA